MKMRQITNPMEREKSSPSEALSIAGICLDPESSTRLRRFAAQTPLIRMEGELDRYCAEGDSALEWITGPGPDICLIDFDADRQMATVTAEKVHEELRGTAIFAVSSNAQPDLIIQAMRCGCSEYLIKPLDQDQLLEAVARVGGRKREKRDQTTGQVLSFVGAKGGAGVTTLVTHLAALLAKSHSRKTLLIDLHRDLGDADLYLGMTDHPYHFYQLLESTDRLDQELLQSFLVRHSSGMDLLPAPQGLEPTHHVSAQASGQVIDFVRMRYDFVLVDCPLGLSEHNMELIHRSDQLYIITLPEVSALRNTARYLDYLGRAEYPSARIKIVLNRYTKKANITDDQIEKAIRRGIDWRVPNQYHQVIRTIHGGDPISQSSAASDVGRNLRALAEALGTKAAPKDSKKKENKGLLGLWGR